MALLAASGVLVSGIGAGAQTSAGAKVTTGGTLNFLSEALTWPTLDPASSKAQGTEQPILSMIYGNLFTVGSTSAVNPAIAKSYSFSKDGLTFTMQIRPGLTFQDGTTLDASAVANSIERDLSPANGCFCRNFLKAITSVTAPNSSEVQINLKYRDGTLLSALATSGASYITSPAAVASEGANFANSPVGAGPFSVVSNTPSSTITLKRFSGYWNARHIYIDNVVVTSEASGTSAYATLQSGGAQLLMVPNDPPVQRTAKHTKSMTIQTSYLGAEFMYMGFKTAPFNNPVARRALQYATDQAPISRSLFAGFAPASESLVGPNEEAYPGNHLAGFPTYNLQKAKQLVRRLGGLSFTVSPLTSGTYNVAEVEALVKEWAKAGINATISLGSEPQALQELETGSFQAILAGYPVQQDAALSMASVLQCPIFFDPGYCDARVNVYMAEALATANVAQRAVLMNEAMTLAIVKDAAFIPLNADALSAITTKAIHGFKFVSGEVYFDGVSLR